MESAKKIIPPLFTRILSHWSQTCHTFSANGLLPTFPLSLSLVTFFYRSYTTSVIDHFVTVNGWSLFSHLPQSLSLIIVILQIIHTFWLCSMLAHPPLLSQSMSLIIDIIQIIHIFWHCSILAHLPLSPQSLSQIIDTVFYKSYTFFWHCSMLAHLPLSS
jgi:hypothetical protein